MMQSSFFLFAFVWMIWSAKPPVTSAETKEDFSAHYQKYGVSGSFLLYDLKNNQFAVYNKTQCETGYLPASTFKIPNTLIALENGIVQDENTIFKWDGVRRSIENWNQDTTLRMAFQNSTVWYYQKIAREVGYAKMNHWLQKLNYGNRSMDGKLDRFWLDGNIRVSQYQQIDFMKRLHQNRLPVSTKSAAVLKSIMIRKDTAAFTYRAKTGWSDRNGKSLGWFVGYITKGENAYFFANRVDGTPENPLFGTSRIEIAESILREKGILP
ncbi:MAG TPA: class D beta-lactamase [Rhodothermales bacterium]|nr:class D beta-lactamase [Rhodothermales bacterium]